MKKSVLLPAGVLAVVAAAAIWILGGSDEPSVELARPASRQAPAPSAPAVQAELDGAADDGETQTAEPASSARVETPAEDLAANWNPEHTRWLEGHVALPPELPADEEIAVYAALAGRFVDSEQPGPDSLLEAVWEHVDGGDERLPAGLVAKASVGPDGAFRLGLPPEGEEFELVAHGRYAFTSVNDIRAVAADAADVRVEADLGSWVRGRLRVPADTPIETLEGLALELDPDPFSMLGFVGGGSVEDREVSAAADGTFEIRGVVPGVSYRVGCKPEELAAHLSEVIPVDPGERVDVDIALSAGGLVQGRVLDEAGSGVAGARVEVRLDVNLLYGQQGRAVRSSETDPEGKFRLAAVAAGRGVVRAEADDYLEVTQDVHVLEDDHVQGVELVLARGSTVAGEVRWPDGAPAANADVAVSFDMNRLGGLEALNMFRGASGSAETDAEGRFEILGLGKGPFTVRVGALPRGTTEEQAEAEGTPRWRARADGVDPDTTDLALVLAEPLGVRGRVVDAAGAPVTEFSAHAIEITGGMIPGIGADRANENFEDPEGRFFLTGLRDGKWNLSAVAEGFAVPAAIAVAVPQPADAELVIVLEEGASVSGVVLDTANQPQPDARVSLEFTLESLRDMTRTFAKPPEAITDSEGRFELVNLTPGGSSIVAQAEGFAQSATLPLDLVSGEHHEGAVLTLRVGAHLTGEVFGDDGEHQAGVQVLAQIPGDIRPRAATTDGAGFFEIEHLVPGTYQIFTMGSTSSDDEPLGDDADDSGIGEMFSSMKMASAELRDGEETHVVLGAPPEDPVHVEGRVVCAGDELSGLFVSFLPEGGGGMSAMKFTQTKGDGRYAVDLEKPGAYLLSVQRVGEMGTQNNFSFNIDVPETDRWEHDVELPVGGLRGRVRDPDGAPAAGVRVSLNSEGAIPSGTLLGNRYTEILTDPEGNFSIDWVPAGDYVVAVGGAPLGGLLGSEGGYGRQVRSGLKVREGQWVEGLDFRLREPATIEGRVRDGSGRPVPEASIFVRDSNGQPVERLSMIQTDGAGRFTYRGLNPGEYTVVARHEGLVSPESAPVRVVEDGKSQVELRLEEGTFLVVVLEEPGGVPIQGSVRVTDEHGNQVNGMLSLSELMGALTDGFSSAEQRVGPLPPGSYRVTATAEDGREASKPVTLRPGAERRLKLRLRD